MTSLSLFCRSHATSASYLCDIWISRYDAESIAVLCRLLTETNILRPDLLLSPLHIPDDGYWWSWWFGIVRFSHSDIVLQDGCVVIPWKTIISNAFWFIYFRYFYRNDANLLELYFKNMAPTFLNVPTSVLWRSWRLDCIKKLFQA